MGGKGVQPTVDINQANPLFSNGANIDNAADAAACYNSTTNPITDTTLIPITVVQPWLSQLPIPNLGGSTLNYTYAAQFAVREDYSQLRVDHHLGANDTLFGRFTFDDSLLHSPFANIQIQTVGAALPQYNTIGRSRNQWVTLGEDHIFTPTVLNSLRLSYSRTNFNIVPQAETVPGINSFGPLTGPNWSAVAGYGGTWGPGSALYSAKLPRHLARLITSRT